MSCQDNEILKYNKCVRLTQIGDSCEIGDCIQKHSVCINGICQCKAGMSLENNKCLEYNENQPKTSIYITAIVAMIILGIMITAAYKIFKVIKARRQRRAEISYYNNLATSTNKQDTGPYLISQII